MSKTKPTKGRRKKKMQTSPSRSNPLPPQTAKKRFVNQKINGQKTKWSKTYVFNISRNFGSKEKYF